MNKREIIERLKNIAGYAVHTVGEEPFVMSIDDGIAVNEAIELLEKPIQPKNGTLIIPLNESDFKSVKRIMLDNKPWCRMFYEDVPGEAHWIKSYTPDDGEVYECDNCGVTWQFTDGGPEENEAFYCPKCGFKMEKGEADG